MLQNIQALHRDTLHIDSPSGILRADAALGSGARFANNAYNGASFEAGARG